MATSQIDLFPSRWKTWHGAKQHSPPLGPFQPHPPTHPSTLVMRCLWRDDRGSSAGAGLRRTLFKAGFVFGGGVFREAASKHLTVRHHSEDSANATCSKASCDYSRPFVNSSLPGTTLWGTFKRLSQALSLLTVDRTRRSVPRLLGEQRVFHQWRHVKMLFMRPLAVDWSSLFLQGYWVLQWGIGKPD